MRLLSPLSLLRSPSPNFLFRSPNPNFLSRNPNPNPSLLLRSKRSPKRVTMMAPAVEEGSAARRFWSRSRKEAVFAAYTPFSICVAAGNLELEAFCRCIAQDAHLLGTFAKAYEMAAEFADDDDDKAAVLDLRKDVLEQLKMHNLFLKDWGVDQEKEVVLPATVKYTNFLLATAQGKFGGGKSAVKIVTPFEKTKIAAYAVGAMTPCRRLFSHLGKEMAMLLPNNDNHSYKKCIDHYSSNDFESAAVKAEDLLDKLSVSLTGKELDFIEELYRQAMKLLTEFFAAQPVTQPAVVPLMKLHDPTKRLLIFSDFDLTCTVVDSCAILAEIAILTVSKADQKADEGLGDVRKTSSNMRSSWEALSRQYTKEYEKCIEDLFRRKKDLEVVRNMKPLRPGALRDFNNYELLWDNTRVVIRNNMWSGYSSNHVLFFASPVKEFDYNVLHKSLEVLASFEKCANLRVVESGMLKGVNLDDIKRAGEHLKFHDGCSEFFQQIVKKKETMSVEFHVLSYCWCTDLIRSAFSTVGCLNDLTVHANELNFEDSLSTGEIVTKMQSPIDKVEAFANVVNESSDEKQLSVYIGDSVGDLLCLLKADVGIVVGESESLRKVGKQFGVSFVPLYPALVMKQRQLADKDATVWKGLSGVLYTASSWREIHAFLLGA